MGYCVISFSLLYDAISNFNHIALCDWMRANNELERIFKESVVAYYEVLYRRLPRGTKLIHETPQSSQLRLETGTFRVQVRSIIV
jgi:hypothetical protein